MINDRERRIRVAILTELDNTPSNYLLNERTLRAGIDLQVCPAVTDAEYESALDRLEADAMVHCEPSALRGKRWCITAIGRAALHQ